MISLSLMYRRATELQNLNDKAYNVNQLKKTIHNIGKVKIDDIIIFNPYNYKKAYQLFIVVIRKELYIEINWNFLLKLKREFNNVFL